jgi:hypothetical protein
VYVAAVIPHAEDRNSGTNRASVQRARANYFYRYFFKLLASYPIDPSSSIIIDTRERAQVIAVKIEIRGKNERTNE